MTQSAQPLNVKPVFFSVPEMVMSLCFSLLTALVAKLRTKHFSLLQCPPNNFSRSLLVASAFIPKLLKNLLSVIPIMTACISSISRNRSQRTTAKPYSSFSVVFSPFWTLVVCAQILSSAFPTPRRDTILAGFVRPEIRQRLCFFAHCATSCCHKVMVANPSGEVHA